MDSMPAKGVQGQSDDPPSARGSEEKLRFAPSPERTSKSGKLKPGLY